MLFEVYFSPILLLLVLFSGRGAIWFQRRPGPNLRRDRVLCFGELIGEALRDRSLLFPVSLPAKAGVDRIVLERLSGLLKRHLIVQRYAGISSQGRHQNGIVPDDGTSP